MDQSRLERGREEDAPLLSLAPLSSNVKHDVLQLWKRWISGGSERSERQIWRAGIAAFAVAPAFERQGRREN